MCYALGGAHFVLPRRKVNKSESVLRGDEEGENDECDTRPSHVYRVVSVCSFLSREVQCIRRRRRHRAVVVRGMRPPRGKGDLRL